MEEWNHGMMGKHFYSHLNPIFQYSNIPSFHVFLFFESQVKAASFSMNLEEDPFFEAGVFHRLFEIF